MLEGGSEAAIEAQKEETQAIVEQTEQKKGEEKAPDEAEPNQS